MEAAQCRKVRPVKPESSNLVRLFADDKIPKKSKGLEPVRPASYYEPDVDGTKPQRSIKAKPRRSTVVPYEASVSAEQFCLDLDRPAVWLRNHYRGSIAALNSRIRTSKAEGTTVDARWRRRGGFRQFLRDIGGPRRHEAMSLDRLNPHDTHYGPGTCRWADKKQQANNRRSNVLVTHPVTGEPATVAQVADHLGMKPNTLRKQIREGKPLPAGVTSGPEAEPLIRPEHEQKIANRLPFPVTREQEAAWRELYRNNRQLAEDGTGFEFIFEFALRWSRRQAHHLTSLAQRMNAEAVARDEDGEEMTAAEEEQLAHALKAAEHWRARRDEALSRAPVMFSELARLPRERPSR